MPFLHAHQLSLSLTPEALWTSWNAKCILLFLPGSLYIFSSMKTDIFVFPSSLFLHVFFYSSLQTNEETWCATPPVWIRLKTRWLHQGRFKFALNTLNKVLNVWEEGWEMFLLCSIFCREMYFNQWRLSARGTSAEATKSETEDWLRKCELMSKINIYFHKDIYEKQYKTKFSPLHWHTWWKWWNLFNEPIKWSHDFRYKWKTVARKPEHHSKQQIVHDWVWVKHETAYSSTGLDAL